MIRNLVSLSGGLDSSTVLGTVAEIMSQECEAVCFKYPSKHNELEREAARKVADHYEVKLCEVDLSAILGGLKSDLLVTGGDLPHGHYTDTSMSRTVVPGRNLLFIATLTAIAISEDFSGIWLGVHQGDEAIYPDCRPGFIRAARAAVEASSDGKVSLYTPFLYSNKADILRFGLESLKRPVPYNLTRTCYSSDGLACGKCGSCYERLESFQKLGITDPVEYQN